MEEFRKKNLMIFNGLFTYDGSKPAILRARWRGTKNSRTATKNFLAGICWNYSISATNFGVWLLKIGSLRRKFVTRKHIRPQPSLQLSPHLRPYPLPRPCLHPLLGLHPDPLLHPSYLFPQPHSYPGPNTTLPNSRMFKMSSLFKKSTQPTMSCDFASCFCSLWCNDLSLIRWFCCMEFRFCLRCLTFGVWCSLFLLDFFIIRDYRFVFLIVFYFSIV